MNNPVIENPLQLSDTINEKLETFSLTKIFKEGEIILNEHAYIRSIPIVKKGSLRVMRTDEEGKEILLYYIKPGETCIMSFLSGIHDDSSKIKVVAEEETEILLVPVDKVRLLIKEYPEWLDYIFKLYHKRFEELLDIVNAVAFKKMDERIIQLLREKNKLTGSPEINTTHQQLADELGTARAVVSRLLKQMETEGMVKLSRNKIFLL